MVSQHSVADLGAWTKGLCSATIPHSPICAQAFRAKPATIHRLCAMYYTIGQKRNWAIKGACLSAPILQCSTKEKLDWDWGIGNSGSTAGPSHYKQPNHRGINNDRSVKTPNFRFRLPPQNPGSAPVVCVVHKAFSP